MRDVPNRMQLLTRPQRICSDLGMMERANRYSELLAKAERKADKQVTCDAWRVTCDACDMRPCSVLRRLGRAAGRLLRLIRRLMRCLWWL